MVKYFDYPCVLIPIDALQLCLLVSISFPFVLSGGLYFLCSNTETISFVSFDCCDSPISHNIIKKAVPLHLGESLIGLLQTGQGGDVASGSL